MTRLVITIGRLPLLSAWPAVIFPAEECHRSNQIILLGYTCTCVQSRLLAYMKLERPRVEPATSWSRVQRSNHYAGLYTTAPQNLYGLYNLPNLKFLVTHLPTKFHEIGLQFCMIWGIIHLLRGEPWFSSRLRRYINYLLTYLLTYLFSEAFAFRLYSNKENHQQA